jgi:hypothetical protein
MIPFGIIVLIVVRVIRRLNRNAERWQLRHAELLQAVERGSHEHAWVTPARTNPLAWLCVPGRLAQCALLPHRACARSGGIWPASADRSSGVSPGIPIRRRSPETSPLHGSTLGMGQVYVRHHAK